jgi:pimeloyl-ACP methyl ester carboxylesterase
MLVWGDEDQIVPRTMQDELLGLLARAELIVYSGAGHTPRWERPVRFAQDVTAFVSRLSG